MQSLDFLIDALDTVLSWDLPEDASVQAASTLAHQMAGLESEQLGVADPE